MKEVYIYDALRTPRGRGRPDGSLFEVKPLRLVTTLLRALTERHGVSGDDVDDIVLGIVNPHGEQGSVLPRVAALAAGWGQRPTGLQVNRFCASGSEAVHIAAAKIASGQADMVVAGGVESMSRVPMGSDGGPWAEDIDGVIGGGYVPQGISGDIIAALDGRTREQLDAYSLRSHQRAARAVSEGRFARSIVPVRDAAGLVILDRDELIRADVGMAGLAKLKPAFERTGALGFDAMATDHYPALQGRLEHRHSAGNASGIADAAAVVLLGSRESGERLGLKPRARFMSGVIHGGDPTIMLAEPAPATRKLLARLNLTVRDIDLYEVNEAFAAVVLRFIDEMQVDPEQVNPNGGAIAMGHPLGATGAILLGTLLDELERRDARRGVVTLCAGGGMGIATAIERIQGAGA